MENEEIACDKLLLAVGRRPLTEGLGLNKAGVHLDPQGRINVTEIYETSVPGICHTWPEAAGVGKPEEELKAENLPYAAGRFNFVGNGRARCIDKTEGFLKILCHRDVMGAQYPYKLSKRGNSCLKKKRAASLESKRRKVSAGSI